MIKDKQKPGKLPNIYCKKSTYAIKLNILPCINATKIMEPKKHDHKNNYMF